MSIGRLPLIFSTLPIVPHLTLARDFVWVYFQHLCVSGGVLLAGCQTFLANCQWPLVAGEYIIIRYGAVSVFWVLLTLLRCQVDKGLFLEAHVCLAHNNTI